MIYGYIRVSTDKQTTENQKLVICHYCENNNIDPSEIIWIDETVSGTVDVDKRELGPLISKLNSGDKLIITELSRLGRNILMIFQVLSELDKKNVSVYSIRENFSFTKDSLQSKVVAFAFGLTAEIERQLLSERTKAGLERARANGSRIGREPGVPLPETSLKCYKHKQEIIDMINKNISRVQIAKSIHVSRNTLWAYIKNYIDKEGDN